MSKPTLTRLPQSKVELKFSVTPDEAKPYLDQAAAEISEKKPIKGFRPGKASYDDVKRAYGEMAIWDAALERIVRAMYVKAVIDEQLDTVGSPEIAVGKIVPNQDLEFTVTATLMPHVTNVMDYSKPLVEQKKKEITDADVMNAIEDLRKMRRVEVAVDRAATKDDAVLIDLEIKKDNVVVEGGVTHDYKVFLNEEATIPGFTEQLVGLKKGDAKSFTLEFPKDHYNKQLAGQPVELDVKIKDVFEMQMPKIDDELAKNVGLPSLEKLKELLKTNLAQEELNRSREAAEIELLEKMTKGSKFSEIPELLVNEEVRRMISELSSSLERQGGNLEDYLKSVKKSKEELTMDFVPRAIERIQTAILIREIGKREQVEITDAEIENEQDKILATLKPGDTQAREMVASPEYREYVGVQLKNRKIVELLRKKAIKE